MAYDVNTFTYGVELEYGNCYRFCDLPDGAQWNDKDNTCVSSTGIANDPSGELYKYGGEINTRPTSTIEEQIEHITKVNAALIPAAIVNYRSNLHIHVRVPGLNQNLDACKKLLQYVNTYQQQAFDIVETIPQPDKNNLTPERYEWELKRMKRRKRSHQYKLPVARYEAMMASTSVQEFYENHAHKDSKGNPAWFQCPRAGINLRQMWEETQTIEFRHFPGTLNMFEMESCIRWCRDFLVAALSDEEITPADLVTTNNYKFPQFQPYEFETEQVYQWTNFDANNRKDIKIRLEALRNAINIDDVDHTTSVQVYNIMMSLSELGV